MLNPNIRSLYTSALTPPPGLIFDEAIATTMSMDPALLLEAPVYLALMAADGQAELKPLLILEAMRRLSKRITVYVQRGRIQIPAITNPLFGFLEDMIVEVAAPCGGVFHPKVWAIRFVSPDQNEVLYRLVVLTRNMTMDRSWDLSLQIEGTMANHGSPQNQPLAHFFTLLPQLATRAPDRERCAQTLKFAQDLHRVQWELPSGFDKLHFFLPGEKEFDWKPPRANRMAIISPFCSDEALQDLAKHTQAASALISRPETLSDLKKETIELFQQCLHLDEAAETEDGEEGEPEGQPLATGLHAKTYLFESRYYVDYTHVVMGSANATNAALRSSRNIEILVELVGKKNRVGGIDELLSADGLGEYLIAFDATKKTEIDQERRKAEKSVEIAQARLSEAALSIKCGPAGEEGWWELVMLGEIPRFDGIISATAWPITVGQDSALNILDSKARSGIRLGEFSASSITGLTAFELKSAHPDVTAKFVLNLPIDGIPEERHSAILQTVIRNQEGFILYLLLLLNDNAENDRGYGIGDRLFTWLSRIAAGEDVPLLEELTRTYSRHPERMAEISELVRKLSQSKKDKDPIIPKDFLDLWAIFTSATGGRDA